MASDNSEAAATPPTRRTQQIFTDGSFFEGVGVGGAAFVAFVGEVDMWEGRAFALSEVNNSDVAEAQAISYAFSWAMANHDLPCDDFLIRCDNHMVYSDIIRLLRATKDTNDMVGHGHELAEAILWKIGRLNDLGKLVRFSWVPSHTDPGRSDTEGNRIADERARRMSKMSLHGYGIGQWEEAFLEFSAQ